MAKQQRINPVALDKAISKHQDWLWSYIKIDGVAIPDWESYDRVYKNYKKSNGLIPEHFTGGKDYKEVFYNDNYNISSFYVSGETGNFDDGLITSEVGLIVQSNIGELFPLIAHRADEELRNLFTYASSLYVNYDSFKLTSIETTIDRVYREFYQNDIRLDDMSKKHVFRLNYEVRYEPDRVNC